MANDENGGNYGRVVRLPDDQFEELRRAMERGTARAPSARPPADLTGRDATAFRAIIHDECDKLYERFKKDQEALFRRLRLPIDEEHINETSDQIAELLAINSARRTAWKSVGTTIVTYVFGGGAFAAIWSYLTSKPH